MISDEQRERLRGLESFLRSRLRGQEHILPLAAAAFHRGELGLASPGRPRGSFLLVGPTGTGKSELIRLCGDYVFGAGHVCEFDLSEYGREDAVALFLGANVTDGGAFGRAMQGRTRGILFFDELDKAHWRLWDLFLQLLDPGHVTLATLERISVAGFYLAFCSNIGGAEVMRMEQSRFATVEQTVLPTIGPDRCAPSSSDIEGSAYRADRDRARGNHKRTTRIFRDLKMRLAPGQPHPAFQRGEFDIE